MDTQPGLNPVSPVVNESPVDNTPTPSSSSRRRINKKYIILSVLVGFMVVALGIAVFFASQADRPSFDIRPRASTPTGVARLILEVGSPIYLGDNVPVKVMLDTAGENISAVGFRLSYNLTSTPPEMEVIDRITAEAGVQIETQGTQLAGDLNATVNSVDISNPLKRVIDFSAVSVSPTGFRSTGAQHLATIWLKANKISTVTINHDAIRSKITKKANGEDILLTMPALLLSTVDDTQAPSITIDTGHADQFVATSAGTTFTWTASDLPARTGGIISPLTYSYSFDNAAWTDTVNNATSITKNLTHGLHTFQVRAKDVKGNFSAPVVPGSKRSFTVNLRPKILTVNPDNGITGQEITITGYNFGTTGTVAFGTVNAAIVPGTWTSTQIKVKVPANAGSTIKVTSASLVSDPVAFSYGTFITLFYKYRGVTSDRGPIAMKAVVKSGTYNQTYENVNATYDTTKAAYKLVIGPMNASAPTAANYSVSIYGGSRLRKRFAPLTITKGGLNAITKIAVADELMPADVNGDNQLDIDDISLLLTKYTQPTNPVNSTNAIYDINYDGVIDIQDITLILSNYKQLEKAGDIE